MTSSQDSKNCRDIKAIYSELLSWKREKSMVLDSYPVLGSCDPGVPNIGNTDIEDQIILSWG